MSHNDFGISRAEIVFIICEAICILFYGLFTEFDQYTSTMADLTHSHDAEEKAW